LNVESLAKMLHAADFPLKAAAWVKLLVKQLTVAKLFRKTTTR